MHVNKPDLKGTEISRPMVPFMPLQLPWQKDDMTFIRALAAFISHDIVFFKSTFSKSSLYHNIFSLPPPFIWIFLRSSIIKVIKSFVHLYNFFYLQGLRVRGIESLKAIAATKPSFESSLTFCSKLLLFQETSHSCLDHGGKQSPVIS